MQALILVGGHGTRLRPVTKTVPKPVIPLVDRPFLGYMVDWLASHGVDDIVMACGFMPDGVRDVLGDGANGGPRIRYMEEPEPRGTAGAIKFAEDLLEDRFLALNGDVLTDLDLTSLVEQHDATGAKGTLALYPVEDPTGYGLVRRKPDGEIIEFLEKPDPSEIDTDEISAGAYVLEKEVLELIPAGEDVSIERQVFPKLVGHGLYSRRLEGYWMDIGTPERYLEACWDILSRRVETVPGSMVDADGRFIHPSATVEGDARVAHLAYIDADSRIGSGAVVGPKAVIGVGGQLGEQAMVEDSALHRGCWIGDGARVSGSILAPNVVVDPGAHVPYGCVIGEGARIGADAGLQPGARVEPSEVLA